jgi:hypothetical protein
MTAQEFEDALVAAEDGQLLTDQGASEKLDALLDAVASAEPGVARSRAIAAARAEFAAM